MPTKLNNCVEEAELVASWDSTFDKRVDSAPSLTVSLYLARKMSDASTVLIVSKPERLSIIRLYLLLPVSAAFSACRAMNGCTIKPTPMTMGIAHNGMIASGPEIR